MGKALPIINKVLSLDDERFEAHIPSSYEAS